MPEASHDIYRVGILSCPCDDSPTFDDYGEAKEAAINLSWNDSPIGIWDLVSGRLEAIVYGQEVYEKE